MSHYAEIDNNNVVIRVLVAEKDFIDKMPGRWIKTSYNTKEGIHLNGKEPLRKNFAGVGFTYDESRDAFIPPKPYPSWVLNEETCTYEAPIPRPEGDGVYTWNEEKGQWQNMQK